MKNKLIKKVLFSGPVPENPLIQKVYQRYEQALKNIKSDNLNVDFISLKQKYYTEPTSPYTSTFNSLGMIQRAVEAEKNGYDAFLIGCAFDPGLSESRSLVDIPVLAPLESAVHFASILGSQFSIIVLDPSWENLIRQKVHLYGLKDKLASVRCPSGLVAEKANAMMFAEDHERLIEIIINEMNLAVCSDNAEVLMVGCTIVSNILLNNKIFDVNGAPIIDLVSVEFKLAEIMIDLKIAYDLKVCKKSIYSQPKSGWDDEIPIT